jgi:hypothetical protein
MAPEKRARPTGKISTEAKLFVDPELPVINCETL